MLFNGNFAFFSIFHQSSMLFNGNFTIFHFFHPFFILFNENFTFFSLFTSFLYYLMGISRFFIVLSIFHIIQWEFKFLSFFINFPYYSMGILHSLGLRASGGDVWMYGRTDGWTDVWNSPLCPTGHRPFGTAAQKRRFYPKNGKKMDF